MSGLLHAVASNIISGWHFRSSIIPILALKPIAHPDPASLMERPETQARGLLHVHLLHFPQLILRSRPVSSQLPVYAENHCLCSNCKLRPVAEVTNCFVDWCHVCDASLWATRPSAPLHHCLCSNCNLRPVAEVTNLFVDWCLECDASLWATRTSASSESYDLIDLQQPRHSSPVSLQLSDLLLHE